jgi:hypothetical protein
VVAAGTEHFQTVDQLLTWISGRRHPETPLYRFPASAGPQTLVSREAHDFRPKPTPAPESVQVRRGGGICDAEALRRHVWPKLGKSQKDLVARVAALPRPNPSLFPGLAQHLLADAICPLLGTDSLHPQSSGFSSLRVNVARGCVGPEASILPTRLTARAGLVVCWPRATGKTLASLSALLPWLTETPRSLLLVVGNRKRRHASDETSWSEACSKTLAPGVVFEAQNPGDCAAFQPGKAPRVVLLSETAARALAEDGDGALYKFVRRARLALVVDRARAVLLPRPQTALHTPLAKFLRRIEPELQLLLVSASGEEVAAGLNKFMVLAAWLLDAHFDDTPVVPDVRRGQVTFPPNANAPVLRAALRRHLYHELLDPDELTRPVRETTRPCQLLREEKEWRRASTLAPSAIEARLWTAGPAGTTPEPRRRRLPASVAAATGILERRVLQLAEAAHEESAASAESRERRLESSLENLHDLANATCAVCLEKLAAQTDVTTLGPCCHSFHTDCINGWFGVKTDAPTCPTCREPAREHETREAKTEEEEGDDDDDDDDDDGGSGWDPKVFGSRVVALAAYLGVQVARRNGDGLAPAIKKRRRGQFRAMRHAAKQKLEAQAGRVETLLSLLGPEGQTRRVVVLAPSAQAATDLAILCGGDPSVFVCAGYKNWDLFCGPSASDETRTHVVFLNATGSAAPHAARKAHVTDEVFVCSPFDRMILQRRKWKWLSQGYSRRPLVTVTLE